MVVSDIIQIAAIIVSLAVSVISIIQSNKSIKLSEKTIEEANRPYIVIFKDYIQVLESVHEYTIVKNFGNVAATIDSIAFNPEFVSDFSGKKVFDNAEGMLVAPLQAITTVSRLDLSESTEEKITVYVKYHDSSREYSEKFTFNNDALKSLVFAKTNPTKSTEIKEVIAKVSEEILRKQI